VYDIDEPEDDLTTAANAQKLERRREGTNLFKI
jgi:hypothetical protein